MTLIDDQTRSQIISQVLEARENRAEFLANMQQRQQRGWAVARQWAKILKEQFSVKRVVLFGSLLNFQRMTWHSDIDLAVWGLPERDYFRAVATLLDVDTEFSIDLVEIQKVQPHILKGIKQGIDL